MTQREPQQPTMVTIPLDDQNALRDWCLETFINPDVERRRAAGEEVEPSSKWTAAQIVFHPGGGQSVRLNQEVTVSVVAVTSKENTDLAKLDEFDEIRGVRAAGADADCAHITFMRFKGKWICAVGLAYNVPIAERHLIAASEFLDAAEDALDAHRFRVFVDNLHSATELMAKAIVYTRDEHDDIDKARKSARHRKLTERFQYLGRAGHIRQAFPKLHAHVQRRRASARYVAVQPLDLSDKDARALLGEAREMEAELRQFLGEAFLPGDGQVVPDP